MRWSIAALAVCLLAAPARADRVYLASGSVLEGKVTRRDDKVIVELESGEIALPSASVIKIESGESELQRVDARHAKLAKGDVKGRIALADYCRDHDLPARERQLLLEVIELEPDHAEARGRLGYVREGHSWISRDEHMRRQGYVLYEGRWMKRDDVNALERSREESARARRTHELELERLELERDKAQAEAELAEAQRDERKSQPEPAPEAPSYVLHYYYGSWPTPVPGYPDCGVPRAGAHCRRASRPPRRHSSSPITYAKDPFDYLRDGR